MPEAPTKLQRWLDVIAFLANRHYPVSTETLWRGVPAYAPGVDGDETQHETVRRMFERDKKELDELGIPIETVRFRVNHYEETDGYRLGRQNFHLPYLELLRQAEGERAEARPRSGTAVFQISEPEAAAALEGLKELASLPAFPLADAARSAFRKLAFDLEPGGADDPEVAWAGDPETEASAPLLERLTPAVRARKTATFHYHSMGRDADEERRVHPYGLLFQHGRWYLVAHDTGRDAVRMFRLGRMRDLAVNTKKPGTADFALPEGFSLSAWAGRRAWELGSDDEATVDATVHFRFPRSLWAERSRLGVLVDELADGAQRRRFRVRRREPFLRWVLSLAGDAWVQDPPELRDAFRALARRAAEVHGEGAGD